jgi:hypothetical protein
MKEKDRKGGRRKKAGGNKHFPQSRFVGEKKFRNLYRCIDFNISFKKRK